jgi:hypothetical protein
MTFLKLRVFSFAEDHVQQVMMCLPSIGLESLVPSLPLQSMNPNLGTDKQIISVHSSMGYTGACCDSSEGRIDLLPLSSKLVFQKFPIPKLVLLKSSSVLVVRIW